MILSFIIKCLDDFMSYSNRHHSYGYVKDGAKLDAKRGGTDKIPPRTKSPLLNDTPRTKSPPYDRALLSTMLIVVLTNV